MLKKVILTGLLFGLSSQLFAGATIKLINNSSLENLTAICNGTKYQIPKGKPFGPLPLEALLQIAIGADHHITCTINDKDNHTIASAVLDINLPSADNKDFSSTVTQLQTTDPTYLGQVVNEDTHASYISAPPHISNVAHMSISLTDNS